MSTHLIDVLTTLKWLWVEYTYLYLINKSQTYKKRLKIKKNRLIDRWSDTLKVFKNQENNEETNKIQI